MSFLLDTNVLIAILNGRPEIVRDKWHTARASSMPVLTSSIVVFELMAGIYKSARTKQNLAHLRYLIASPLEVLPFDHDDADVAGQIRAALERKGRRIGRYDLLIAGQALRHGFTMVTASTDEFQRVKGLKVENWELA